MSEPFESQGPLWLEQALGAWAVRHALSEPQAQNIARAVVQDAAPDLPSEWWKTIFPKHRFRTAF